VTLFPGGASAAVTRLSAYEYQSVLSSSIYPMDLSLKCEASNFSARFETRQFGDLSVIMASANQPISLRRRPGLPRRGDELLLKHQTFGRALHRYDGTSVMTGGNTMTIIQPDQEEGAEQIDPARCVMIRMPRDLVESRINTVRLSGCILLNAPDVIKDVFRDILDTMWTRHTRMTTFEQRATSAILLDLVAASIMTDTTGEIHCVTRQTKITLIKSAIEKHLSDPDLSLASVSQKIGMSRSAICAAMQEAGTTVGNMIIDMRLQRVRDALLDPNFDAHTVSNIIYNHGFGDISHCIRRFKEKYGYPPATYRRLRDSLPASCAPA